MIVDTDALWKGMDNYFRRHKPEVTHTFPHRLDNSLGVTHSINNTATTYISKKCTKRGEGEKFQVLLQECRL
jgi:hypothetical protein